ncbi:ornithine carbamoyltransferase [Deltaproteobacteria bacterium OttesenSCG-928-K17]|nr:ornithine carbamoyltransferase [Deltaproteobacteria bacterium OttesenSCG-928-K17]
MTRHFIKFTDLTRDEFHHVIEMAHRLKAERHNGNYLHQHLRGRSVGMLFNKNSTRTRISFECGITELGGHAVVLSEGQTQFSRGESASHSARVMERYLAGLVIRTYAQSQLDDLAKYGSMPIINALTDEGHPCQILTDIFTAIEKFPNLPLEKIKMAWIGDGNNMANSWIEAAGLLGFPLTLACPEGYEPDQTLLAAAKAANPQVKLVRDPKEAVAGALAVNTDVWASMGQEEEKAAREKVFKNVYLVDSALMAKADPKAIFMHCLPAHPGEEVTDEVLESPASVIFDEAENRLHAQKALMKFLIPCC